MTELWRRFDPPEGWEWENHPEYLLIEGPNPFMLMPVERGDIIKEYLMWAVGQWGPDVSVGVLLANRKARVPDGEA